LNDYERQTTTPGLRTAYGTADIQPVHVHPGPSNATKRKGTGPSEKRPASRDVPAGVGGQNTPNVSGVGAGANLIAMNSSESTIQQEPVLCHSHRGDFHLALAFQNVDLTKEQYAQTTKLPFEKWDESLKQRFPWANSITDEVTDSTKTPPGLVEQ
jgi:hypothetical protein